MVIKIVEDRVTLLSDQNNTEITVFSKDLRESSDSGGSGSLGQYALWDLVQLDPSTVACITKVDRESLVVLDQNGQSRTVLPSQISNKLERRRFAVATDRNGSEIRNDDVVKEVGGEGKSGKIIHIHRSYLFLHSQEQHENAGVFVVRTTNVATVAAKGGRVNAAASGPDLTAMNPALQRNNGTGSGSMQPPKSFGRDRAIGQTVTIRRGPYKGLLGIVKEATDTNARVELHTKGKTVNVPRDALGFRDKVSGAVIDPDARGGRGGSRGGFGAGGRGGYGGATPGSVPSWDGGSRTPMAAALTDRTPAWGARSKLYHDSTLIHNAKPLQHQVALVMEAVHQHGRRAEMEGERRPGMMDHAQSIPTTVVEQLTAQAVELPHGQLLGLKHPPMEARTVLLLVLKPLHMAPVTLGVPKRRPIKATVTARTTIGAAILLPTAGAVAASKITTHTMPLLLARTYQLLHQQP